MTIGKRIRKVREERGKTLLQVANFLGVSEATAQRYESGNIKNLKLDTITNLSKFLNVDPAYLMGWKSYAEDLVTSFDYNYYPTTVSAGIPLDADSVTNENVEVITVPNHLMGKCAGSKDIFFTKINGDSMNRVIPDQSLIAVKPVEIDNLKDNDIVVYSKNGEYAVKRYFNFGDEIEFRPDSHDKTFRVDTIQLDNDIDLKIKGKVVLYIVELD